MTPTKVAHMAYRVARATGGVGNGGRSLSLPGEPVGQLVAACAGFIRIAQLATSYGNGH